MNAFVGNEGLVGDIPIKAVKRRTGITRNFWREKTETYEMKYAFRSKCGWIREMIISKKMTV